MVMQVDFTGLSSRWPKAGVVASALTALKSLHPGVLSVKSRVSSLTFCHFLSIFYKTIDDRFLSCMWLRKSQNLVLRRREKQNR